MKIFGKHIFRSIKAKPYQPIMIILIIAVSVAVALSSVILPIAIYRDSVAGYKVDEWTEDLTVTLKSTADVRLIFEEDIASAIGEGGRVLGEFSLSGTYRSADGAEMKSTSVSALDILRADSFYEIRYTEYGKFTSTNIKASAIVSERYAEARGLLLGDSFAFTLLGREYTYTVQAIAMNIGIFNERDALVDIGGLRELLAERSPLIASLGTEFNPYTRVNIKLYDKAKIEQTKAYLESLDYFADKKVTLRANAGEGDPMPMMRTLTVVMPGVLLFVIAVMLIVSSLDLLQKKRRADIALFKIAGADEGHLNALSYLESSVYGVVGGVLGALITRPLTVALNGLFDFKHVRITYGIAWATVGIPFAVGFAMLCTAINIAKQKRKSLSAELSADNFDTEKRISVGKLLLLVPTSLLGVIAFVVPTRYAYIAVAGFIFSLIACVYKLVPYLLCGFSRLLLGLIKRARRGFGDLILASRSLENSYPLKHAGRLMTIIISVFISVSFILFAVGDQMDSYTDFAKFDSIAVDADEDTADMLARLEGVDALASAVMDRNVSLNGAKLSMGISVNGDAEGCFDDSMLPTRFPKGDEVAIARGVAKMIGAKVGDRVECVIDDIPCTLTVTEIVSVRADFVFYDAEYVGTEYSMLCIRSDGSYESAGEIKALLDERGVECLDGEEFFATTYEILNPHVTVVSAMFYVMLIMTVLGIANILTEQRMARASEVSVLRQNGKTGGGIIALMTKEILLILLYSLIISAAVSTLLCIMVDKGATSFGMSVLK